MNLDRLSVMDLSVEGMKQILIEAIKEGVKQALEESAKRNDT